MAGSSDISHTADCVSRLEKARISILPACILPHAASSLLQYHYSVLVALRSHSTALDTKGSFSKDLLRGADGRIHWRERCRKEGLVSLDTKCDALESQAEGFRYHPEL